MSPEMEALRRAIAEYMASEGCSCCGDYDKHKEDKARLAKMLDVPMYSDGSGYDFGPFRKGYGWIPKGGV